MGGEVELEHPIDSDAGHRTGWWRRELVSRHAPVLVAVAFGGGLGSLARYGLTVLLPTHPGQFPWATFFENVLGCLLIGVLMVLITERWTVHRLVRPFLGVGVLGGFTTFSTYAVEIRGLLQPGTIGLAFAYLAGTFLGAMLAVITGASATRAVLRMKADHQEAA